MILFCCLLYNLTFQINLMSFLRVRVDYCRWCRMLIALELLLLVLIQILIDGSLNLSLLLCNVTCICWLINIAHNWIADWWINLRVMNWERTVVIVLHVIVQLLLTSYWWSLVMSWSSSICIQLVLMVQISFWWDLVLLSKLLVVIFIQKLLWCLGVLNWWFLGL